jgi:hypothetical protein
MPPAGGRHGYNPDRLRVMKQVDAEARARKVEPVVVSTADAINLKRRTQAEQRDFAGDLVSDLVMKTSAMRPTPDDRCD